MNPKQSDELSEQEAARRRDEVLRHMISRPPTPHQTLKAKGDPKKKGLKRVRKSGAPR